VQVTLPARDERSSRRKLTEEEFFEELVESADPNAVDLSRWALDNADDHQLQISWGDAGPLLQWVDEASGNYFTFGQLSRRAYLSSTQRLLSRCQGLGLPREIWLEYSDEIIRLVPGAYRKKRNKGEEIAMKTGTGKKESIPLTLLWPCKEQWFAAIDRAIDKLRAALAQ
jgi:hypothetical protein